MDLYDHLLAVGPAGLTVLTRRAGGCDETVVPYGQIAAIEDSVNLLDGRLTLRTLGADVVAIPSVQSTPVGFAPGPLPE